MTEIFPFLPSSISAFTFQPTLNDVQYNITVTWNLFGQRYYVNCYTLTGTLIFSLPLIGSDNGINIQEIDWSLNIATVTTNIPHRFKVGQIVNVTISNMVPAAYNGVFSATIINSTQFTYSLSSYPGNPTSFGTASYDINIAAGYFTSTLVYRTNNQQFEVSP